MLPAEIADHLLSAPIGLQFLDLVARTNYEHLPDDELLVLAGRAREEMSIYASAYEAKHRALGGRRHDLKAVAGWVASRVAYWWGDLDRGRQCWQSMPSNRPAPALMQVDLSPFSTEVPKPKRALWTSTFRVGSTTDWMEFPETANSAPHQFGTLWNLKVPESARVFEIRSPRDWWTLATLGPIRNKGHRWTGTAERPAGSVRTDPDWATVANYWDGVHLSIGGLLTTEDRPFEMNGLITELRSWNVESTAWLRWSFSSARVMDTGST